MIHPAARGAVGLMAATAWAAYRHATSVTRQNSPFRRAWERHLLRVIDDLDGRAARGDPLPFVYAALGDSAAQGLGASRIEEGYVPRIAAGLRTALGSEVALANLSLSGGTVESVLATQIPQLAGLRVGGEPLRPDLVTLDIGGNDVGLARLGEEEFAALVRRILACLPRPVFVANIPTFRPLPSARRAERLSAILDVEARAAGCCVIDVRSVSEAMPLWSYMIDYHAADMFHPNSPWYHRWSQLFMDSICRHLGIDSVDMDGVGPWSPPGEGLIVA